MIIRMKIKFIIDDDVNVNNKMIIIMIIIRTMLMKLQIPIVIKQLPPSPPDSPSPPGNYSCLRALITLERNIGFHLVQSYLPSILIVVISWMGFWMDTDSVPARTCLGVTTLLTVSNQASGEF